MTDNKRFIQCPLCCPVSDDAYDANTTVVAFEAEVGHRDGGKVDPYTVGMQLLGICRSHEGTTCDAHFPVGGRDDDVFHVVIHCRTSDAPVIADELRGVPDFMGAQLSRAAAMLLGRCPKEANSVAGIDPEDPAIDPTNFPDETYLGC